MEKLENNNILQKLLPLFQKVFAVHEYPTQNTLSNKLYVSQTRLVKFDQSIKIIGAKIWNSLPNSIKNKCNNPHLYSKLLKKHYLNME